jgi:hypothetical protein
MKLELRKSHPGFNQKTEAYHLYIDGRARLGFSLNDTCAKAVIAGKRPVEDLIKYIDPKYLTGAV